MSENNPLHIEPPAAVPMHPHDRRLLAIFNWAGNVGGALTVGCYIAWAIGQMPFRPAAYGMAIGLIAMTGATIYAFRQRSPVKRGYSWSWSMIIAAIVLTWGLLGWQTWMWFHPPAQGFTKADLDQAAAKSAEIATKAQQNEIAELTKENDALRKSARQQSASSDTPINVDRIPTSLRLLFKGDSVEGVDPKNVVWTSIYGYRERKGLLAIQGVPGWTILLVFKKPIAYKEICFGANDTAMPPPTSTKDPRYAVVEFDPVGIFYGLIDLSAANECKK